MSNLEIWLLVLSIAIIAISVGWLFTCLDKVYLQVQLRNARSDEKYSNNKYVIANKCYSETLKELKHYREVARSATEKLDRAYGRLNAISASLKKAADLHYRDHDACRRGSPPPQPAARKKIVKWGKLRGPAQVPLKYNPLIPEHYQERPK